MSVLQSTALFVLPVDTQDTQCARRFYIPLTKETTHKGEDSAATKPRPGDTAFLYLYHAVRIVDNRMPCYRTGFDMWVHWVDTSLGVSEGSAFAGGLGGLVSG